MEVNYVRKNRIFLIFVSLVLSVGLLSGCGKSAAEKEGNTSEKKSVVCTIFPEYDWTKEVIGDLKDEYEVTLLLDNGVDLHSYQPTAADIAKMATCDVFIYVGGESDGWVEDALAEATNKDMQVINLLDVLGDTVKEEEIKEGMEAEEEEEGEVESEEGPEYDEHVWLSLKNAQILASAIKDSLKIVDPTNADIYEDNCNVYTDKLLTLDGEYSSTVKGSKHKTLLFGDRFPFRYLVDDYGLDYYAAFVGCSAETEASFETICFLAGKVDEIGLSNIVVIENSNHKIAQTIIDNTKKKNQNIIVLDSMQSTTSKDIEAGETYLSIMKKNLDVLKTALN